MRILIIVIVLISGLQLFSREINLEECRKAAQDASPTKKQLMLNSMKRDFENKSLGTNFLPQLSIDGQVSYQSDVVKFNLSMPGLALPEIPKEQYKISLNLTQTLWDGGATSAARGVKDFEQRVSTAAVEAGLYNINDVINQLFFNIMLSRENIKTLELIYRKLDSNKNVIESLVRNGVMLRSNLESINIEMLKIEQSMVDLKSAARTLINSLSLLTEMKITENDEFLTPGISTNDYKIIKRKELNLFNERDMLAEAGREMLVTQIMPKVFLFGQGGYGNPNPFNFLESEGSFYYIFGLKFQWNPFDWGSNAYKRQSLELNREYTSTERDNFIKNLKISISKEESEIVRYEELQELDSEIIAKQQTITEEYFSKLKNSVITVTDYTGQVNSLMIANINRDIHKIKQLMSRVNLLTITGNL